MKLVLMGGGRVASAVFPALAGSFELLRWGRGQPVPVADAYWVLVTDHAIADVAALLPDDAVVLHAAGSLGPEVLGARRGGVLHPLMSFGGGAVVLRGVCARIEGHADAMAVGDRIATALGLVLVHEVDRVRWHLAACLASGHLAALFIEATEVLRRAGVAQPAEALLPLARASLEAVAASGSLTGPAARGDEATVERHRAVLGAEAATYNALDQRIRARRRSA